LADYLVRKGIPFRHAHHAVGAAVAMAEKQNKKLNQLTLADYQSAHEKFGPDVLEVFDLNKAMKARVLTGSPGTAEVKKQLRAWRKRL
jgi:argininosuccinate lyase